MIELKKLTIGYRQKDLLIGADACFHGGELTALIGRNGSGKSTLLRAIAGLNKNFSGQIELAGTNSSKPRSQQIAYVNTERVRIPCMTALQVVAIGRSPYTSWSGKLSPHDLEVAADSLKMVGLEEFANRKIGSLSDGEAQRVMIARALAQDTPNIILDEPTSFLDLPNRYELMALLRRLAEEYNKCILLSTHELDIALKTCHKIALISDLALHVDTPGNLQASGLLNQFTPSH